MAIIQLTKIFTKSYENIIVIKQIIRSSTSIGANVEEALGANSRKDFIHCMNIAKKEARETRYWLRLLRELHVGNQNAYVQLLELLRNNEEIINILTSIVKTSSKEKLVT